MDLLLAGVALLLVTGGGALVLARRPFVSTLLAASGAVAGCALADLLLPRQMRPRARPVKVTGLFPPPGDFAARAADPLLEGAYEPFFVGCGRWFSRLRILQQGKTHIYLLYIAAMVVASLAWVSVRAGWATP